MKKIGFILIALFLPLLVQAEDYREGVHYVKLTTPVRTIDQSKVEVVEMFGYPCPHCNSFEPYIKNWNSNQADDVNFVRIPVVFGRSWEPMARAFYASELMKTLDKTHEATFHAIHVERRRFAGMNDFSEFYANLGLDRGQFDKMYNSFAVNMKLKQGDSKLRGYGVEGVPAMIVNGKYRISAQMAGGQQEMLKVVNFLVEKERSAAE
ncbi:MULTISPECIES: thiol:disulfide interchange protein DsbA/DsbL [unclassified Neptuniibacter]|jgi:thiol:disulfide interchange protein DsbA|uniref:thiol:disulfide interchange protein DsbA/DsbL n=1 Tax=unclassified Neptuniibacter TaxID=2630693 RepID=UPI0026E19F34|nr:MULTISPECIES: thiol:disulfide interchange protein DsbA/DsbL [unclassified Neptuniibacter]MDO6513959.1 thiol:disulfide interchange protein DsbA/DsbL [Neptuniibacter sp. 2_MG-2023]MDO6594199.1 thiol:disulfide interchange protein DsbA/DsbL [Neptuniibacter sp. 1_MG-2023]